MSNKNPPPGTMSRKEYQEAEARSKFDAKQRREVTQSSTGKEQGSSTIQVGTYDIDNEKIDAWYKALPYGFRVKTKTGTILEMFLPISPSNLTISTNFATNLIPTLYGTVEEHSEVRYFDIDIRGTTGISPQFASMHRVSGNASSAEAEAAKRAFGGASIAGRRTSFPSSSGLISNIGLNNTKTGVALETIFGKAMDIIGGVVGSNNNYSGVNGHSSGYLAFHNLYRFLLMYKHDVASGSKGKKSDTNKSAGHIDTNSDQNTHPITFFNYKDNNEYNVVVQRFVLERSASSPMLYNYQITMRGYNLRTAGDKDVDDSLQSRIESLGLSSGNAPKTLIGKFKTIIGGIKGIASAGGSLFR